MRRVLWFRPMFLGVLESLVPSLWVLSSYCHHVPKTTVRPRGDSSSPSHNLLQHLSLLRMVLSPCDPVAHGAQTLLRLILNTALWALAAGLVFQLVPESREMVCISNYSSSGRSWLSLLLTHVIPDCVFCGAPGMHTLPGRAVSLCTSRSSRAVTTYHS